MDVKEERQIAIKKLLLYPVRGVQGFEVPQLTMTESGPMYDRLWVIITKTGLKVKDLTKSVDTMIFT